MTIETRIKRFQEFLETCERIQGTPALNSPIKEELEDLSLVINQTLGVLYQAYGKAKFNEGEDRE